MEKAKENARTRGEAEAKHHHARPGPGRQKFSPRLDQLRRRQQKQINFQELNDAKAAVQHSLNQAQEALHLRSASPRSLPMPPAAPSR